MELPSYVTEPRHNGSHNLRESMKALEAQMQGALAWVRQRDVWPAPAFAINLEILGQDGRFVLWERDGTALRRLATSVELNAGLGKAIQSVTGVAALRAPDISSDAFAFLSRRIPATTMGSFDAEKADRGLRSRHDNPDRVAPSRLHEALAVLSQFLTDTDRPAIASSRPDPPETK